MFLICITDVDYAYEYVYVILIRYVATAFTEEKGTDTIVYVYIEFYTNYIWNGYVSKFERTLLCTATSYSNNTHNP